MGSWVSNTLRFTILWVGMTALILGWSPGPVGAAPPPAEGAAARGQELYSQGLELIRAGKNREAVPLLEQALPLLPGNRHVMADYTANLVWTGDYQRAIAYYTAHLDALHDIPYLQKHIAKAFYEQRDFLRAREHYERAWQADPRDAEAFKGLIYSCCRLKDYTRAAAVWETGHRRRLVSTEALISTRVFILEHLGVSGEALKAAREGSLDDPALLTRLTGDVAATRLRWDEFDEALALLEGQLAQDPENFRARGDYLVALRQKDRMTEALQQFERLQQAGKPIPYWVHEAVADAHLYLQHPEQAIPFYRLVVEELEGRSFEALKGLFYCHIELSQWREAQDALERLTALVEKRGSPNEKNEVANLKGQLLIYQDRNKDAATNFVTYLGQAGLNSALRGGLGQAYLNRGWPRRALEQFKIVQSTDPDDKPSRVGKAYALNELNYKDEARALARELYTRYPTDYHVKELRENLRVEDSPYLSTDVFFTREYTGATEYYLVSELNVPFNPYFRVFTQMIRQAISDRPPDEEDIFYAWNRLAFGFDWIMLPQVEVRQALSFDYLTGRDFGSFTQVRWRPTDPLRITAEYDSFALNVPIRARATGLRAKRPAGEILYNESDLRNYGLRWALNLFADDNTNPDLSVFFRQNVLNEPAFKVWAGAQVSYGRYTKQDVPYYSPVFNYQVLFTPHIHWIHYQRYDRKIRSSFYFRGGLSKQIAYDPYAVGGITYEPTLQWSKSFEVKANVSYDTKVYDGVYTHVLGAYLGFKKYF